MAKDEFKDPVGLGRATQSAKARAAKAKRLRKLRGEETGLAGGGKRTFEAAVRILKGKKPDVDTDK